MTPLAELRKKHRESYEKAGLKLSYMPFIMNATVAALKASPAVNASWGGEKLILHKRVHLGVAVSIEGGLVVPVIRNADDLSVRQLAGRLAEVADHARTGKLAADEVRGGTFTITNPGIFGTVFSTPIINPPEAAILAVCRIAETPVAREGKIVDPPHDEPLPLLRPPHHRRRDRHPVPPAHPRGARGGEVRDGMRP